MKKLALFMLFLVCFALPLIGQNYVYHDNPSPSGGSANTFPFGNAFGNNWRYHFSVPALSLPTKPVRFVGMAFAPTATGVFSVKDFQLRMGHSASHMLSSVFATNIGASPTTLIDVQGTGYNFNATVNQWTPLGVKNGFDYDGKSALVIEVRYRGFGTLHQGSPSIRSYTSAMSSGSYRVWANGSYPPAIVDPYSTPVGWNVYSSGAIRVRLTYVETVITLSGSTSPGGTVDLDLASFPDPNRPYQAASSLGTGPIPIDTRMLHLSVDDLLVISVNGYLPSIFLNYTGKLDAGGKAKAQIKIPNDPVLKGVKIHSAFITLDPAAPSGVSNISNTVTLTIT